MSARTYYKVTAHFPNGHEEFRHFNSATLAQSQQRLWEEKGYDVSITVEQQTLDVKTARK